MRYIIRKSLVHKYYKREGTKGNYKYYYTKDEYDKAKKETEPIKEKSTSNETIILKRGLSKDWLSAIDKYLQIVPKKAVPTAVMSFTSLKKTLGRDIFNNGEKTIYRESKYGVALDQDSIKIPKENFPKEIADKMIELKWLNPRVYEIAKELTLLDKFTDQSINTVAFNSSDYPTNKELIVSKNKGDKFYESKYGIKYSLNHTIEGLIVHELGHVYNNRTKIANSYNWTNIWEQWKKENNLGVLKDKSEAFSEAFSNYFVENGKDLPKYINEYLKENIK